MIGGFEVLPRIGSLVSLFFVLASLAYILMLKDVTDSYYAQPENKDKFGAGFTWIPWLSVIGGFIIAFMTLVFGVIFGGVVTESSASE